MSHVHDYALEPDRLTFWGTERPKGTGPILYWMQASPRLTDNLALSWATAQARQENRELAVLSILDPEESHPYLARQFYEEGLAHTAQLLQEQGLTLVLVRGSTLPILTLATQNAGFVVLDRAYTQEQRHLRRELARVCPVPLVGVEDNVLVPVTSASPKEEWSAATFRPKFWRAVHNRSPEYSGSWTVKDGGTKLAAHLVDHGVEFVKLRVLPGQLAGESAAQAQWQDFLARKLTRYGLRNDPLQEVNSGLSPYLRFGFISPLTLFRDLQAENISKPSVAFVPAGTDPHAEFQDEVFVRRELSVNFLFYQPLYAHFEGLPAWAQATLQAHRQDPREALYREDEWDTAQTHDEVWNTCQLLLRTTGQMPGYLRMYWGKKFLEWSATPEEGFRTAVTLNNRWSLDGNDPNSWAGVAWCFGKHDRPWGERAVWGTIRSMKASGLKRKFDVDGWLSTIRPKLVLESLKRSAKPGDLPL